MITKIFTVFDSKTESYLQPFHAQTTGHAIRSFETACATPDHDFSKFSADFTLFEIGTFDDQSCTFNIHEAKINLGNAIEFMPPANPDNMNLDLGSNE